MSAQPKIIVEETPASILESILAIAHERAALLEQLRIALNADDWHTAERLARRLCGLEERKAR